MIKLAKKSRNEYQALKAHQETTEVKAEPPKNDHKLHTSLYHALLASHMPEVEKAARRMAHEGFEILLAGSDTTARTMGILVFHLAANPSLSQRLQDEIRTVLPKKECRINLQEIETLIFLVGPYLGFTPTPICCL